MTNYNIIVLEGDKMIDLIIIILLVILIIIGVISLFKNINESHITERLGKLELNMMKEMGDFKTDISRWRCFMYWLLNSSTSIISNP